MAEYWESELKSGPKISNYYIRLLAGVKNYFIVDTSCHMYITLIYGGDLVEKKKHLMPWQSSFKLIYTKIAMGLKMGHYEKSSILKKIFRRNRVKTLIIKTVLTS